MCWGEISSLNNYLNNNIMAKIRSRVEDKTKENVDFCVRF